MRFRGNMERLGELLAYELSKSLQYAPKQIKTPLGVSTVNVLKEDPVLVTILRAGIPFFQGFLNYFDKAASGFIGAYRAMHDHNEGFNINMEYLAVNDISQKELIIVDPMLATGKSMIKSISTLMKYGKPGHIHIVTAIAAPEGIDYIKKELSYQFTIWAAAVDEKLNDKAYIVPGLGDAGDLSYGAKL